MKVLLPTRFYLPVVNVFIKLRAIFNSLHIRVTTSDNMSAQVKLNGTTTIYHFKRCDISGTEDILYRQKCMTISKHRMINWIF